MQCVPDTRHYTHISSGVWTTKSLQFGSVGVLLQCRYCITDSVEARHLVEYSIETTTSIKFSDSSGSSSSAMVFVAW